MCEFIADPFPRLRPVDERGILRLYRSLDPDLPGFENSHGLPDDYLDARDVPGVFFHRVIMALMRTLLEMADFEFSYEYSFTVWDGTE